MTILATLRRSCAAALLATLFGLVFGGACAAQEKHYEGFLLPEGRSGGIPVTIGLRSIGGVLVGRVKAGPPISGVATVSSGEMNGDKCDFQAPFQSGTTLQFTGNCQTTRFEGRYTTVGRRDPGSYGSFRLAHAEPDAADQEEARNAPLSSPLLTVTDCITANTRCLTACPQGDYNVEFLCANRCRSKFKACKGKAALP